MAAQPGTTTPEQELAALKKIATELAKLDPAAQGRAIRWLTSAFPETPAADDPTSGDHYADPYPPDTTTPR